MLSRILALVTVVAVFGFISSELRAAPKEEEEAFRKEFWNATKLHAIHLEFTNAEWQKMQPAGGGGPKFGKPGFGGPGFPKKPAQPAGDTHRAGGVFGFEFPWASGDITIAGKTFKNVGARYKGNYTYLLSAKQLKRSMKITLDRHEEDQELYGIDKLNLSSGVTDPTRMREALSFAVLRAAGVAAPRTAYAEVTLTVPGKYDRETVGVFTLIEQVDKKSYLKAHFGDGKGLLVKPENLRGLDYLGESWDRYETSYRPKNEGSPKEQQRLIDFARLVNKGSEEQFRKEIGSYLDVDQFLRYLAANALLANLDSFLGFGHNYYLYLRPDTNQFVFIPWDVDFSCGTWPAAGSAEQQLDLSISHPHLGQNKLIDRLLAMDEVKENYQRILKELATTCFTTEKLLPEIDALEKATKQALAREAKAVAARKETGGSGFGPPKGGFGPALGGIGKPFDIRRFVEKRTASVTAQLAGTKKGYVSGGFGFGGPGFGGGGQPGMRPGFPGGGQPGVRPGFPGGPGPANPGNKKAK
jgi:spore coat protein H